MLHTSHSFHGVLVYRNGHQFRAGKNITISEFDNCKHMKGEVVIVATKHKTTHKRPVRLVLSQNNYQYIQAYKLRVEDFFIPCVMP